MRHDGPAGAVNRARLRKELADWLRAQADDEAWQKAVVELGESGLALEIAAQEKERGRERARAASRLREPSKRPPAPPRGCESLRAADVGDAAIPPLVDGDDNVLSVQDDVPADLDPEGLLQAQDQEDIGPFEVQTLMDYIGATAEYEAYRLARSLKPEQLTALVDKCAQHPAIMAASDHGGRQRKGVTREDVQTALAAASGNSRGTPRSRRVRLSLRVRGR